MLTRTSRMWVPYDKLCEAGEIVNIYVVKFRSEHYEISGI